MNTLLSRRLGGFLLAASLLSSCNQDPQSANQPSSFGPLSAGGSGGGSTPAANPVIVYANDATVSRTTYGAIFVMNADATNLTRVITSSVSGGGDIHNGRWSHDGAHFTYQQAGTVSVNGTNKTTWAVKRADLAVVSGVPTASNLSTIATAASPDYVSYSSAAWAPGGTQIAIAGYSLNNYFGSYNFTSRVWLIPASGGTRTLLYAGFNGERINDVTWSPDGSQVAFIGADLRPGGASNLRYIKIVTVSTGTVTDSILSATVGTSSMIGLEWSRTGANKLLYCSTTSSTSLIKMFDLDNRGNGEVTIVSGNTAGNYGQGPSWSPDNAKMMYNNTSFAPYTWTFSTSTATSLAQGRAGNWKP
jgi:WD40 repeat protein